MASSTRARLGAARKVAAPRGVTPLQMLPSAAFAALLLLALAGCGGSPSEADVRAALDAQVAVPV